MRRGTRSFRPVAHPMLTMPPCYSQVTPEELIEAIGNRTGEDMSTVLTTQKKVTGHIHFLRTVTLWGLMNLPDAMPVTRAAEYMGVTKQSAADRWGLINTMDHQYECWMAELLAEAVLDMRGIDAKARWDEFDQRLRIFELRHIGRDSDARQVRNDVGRDAGGMASSLPRRRNKSQRTEAA